MRLLHGLTHMGPGPAGCAVWGRVSHGTPKPSPPRGEPKPGRADGPSRASLHRAAEVVVPDGALPRRGGVQGPARPLRLELQQRQQSEDNQGTSVPRGSPVAISQNTWGSIPGAGGGTGPRVSWVRAHQGPQRDRASSPIAVTPCRSCRFAHPKPLGCVAQPQRPCGGSWPQAPGARAAPRGPPSACAPRPRQSAVTGSYMIIIFMAC